MGLSVFEICSLGIIRKGVGGLTNGAQSVHTEAEGINHYHLIIIS